MKKYKITDFNINHLGLNVTVLINYDTNDSFSRVFFISKYAVSRHVNLKNLKDCLSGKLSFKRDAFIFTGDRAISEIKRNLLNATDITEYQVNVLNEYIMYLNNSKE